MSTSRCALGLLTWNGERDVVHCLRSVREQTEPNIEIAWVDNASTDHTAVRVRENFPDFASPDVLSNNIGFCGGHNRLFRATRAKYYLALNQDATLAPDYIQKICDWMDEDESLALASGLILWGNDPGDPNAKIYSAGMAMGYGRFPFEIHRNQLPTPGDRERRIVPAVTGAAFVVRRSAIETINGSSGGLFPEEFFAYFEEVDLALRVARAGFRCGVEGSALACHAERGAGGIHNPEIRAHYLKNHWLVSLRNDSWGDIARELPQIVKGELQWYLPKYLRTPATTLRAISKTLQLFSSSRREYRDFTSRFSESHSHRAGFYAASRKLLRELRD